MAENPQPPRGQQGSGKPSLSRVAAGGFAWLMLQSLTGRVVGLAGQLVLAWLLVPADFGLVALVYTVTNMAAVVANFGVDEVMMQRMRKLNLWTTPGFWMSLGLGLAGMAVVLAVAPLAAHFYKSPAIVPLSAIIALSMPLGALSTAPAVALRARMNFRFLATYNVIELVLAQILTIALAWRGFGAYSFVIPAPTLALVRAAAYWLKAPTPIRGRMRMVQIRYLASRGSAVFGSRALIQAVANGDYFILGLLASPTVVGLYFFAFKLSVQPVRMLAGNFTNVLFPALAQLRFEPERQRAAAYNAARILAYVSIPFCFLQAAAAEPGLSLFFGSKWRDATPLVQLLSLGLPFDAVSWIAGALMAARGEFRRSFVYSCIFSPAFFMAVALGAFLGSAQGVALGVAAFYAAVAPIYSSLVFGTRGRRLAEAAELYVVPFALSAAAIGGAYALSFLPVFGGRDLLRLVWIGLIGPLAYLGLMTAFKRELLNDIAARFHLSGLLRSWPPKRPAIAANDG